MKNLRQKKEVERKKMLAYHCILNSQIFVLDKLQYLGPLLHIQTYIKAVTSQLFSAILTYLIFMLDRINLSRLRAIVQTQTLNIGFVLIITLCGCNKSEPKAQSSKDKEKFLVMVIGDGVPPIDMSQIHPFPINTEQGEAMYNGAFAALNESPNLKDVNSIVEICGIDDRGDPERASQIAKEIRYNSRVLAVIGHATSGTTLHSAWVYEQAGIPILMPIATSPDVMYPPKKTHLEAYRIRNAFRLPPSDDKGQAPAVAHLVWKLGLKKVYLLSDITEGAKEYSKTLRDSLEPYIRKEVINKKIEVAREKTNFAELARSIRAQGIDGVIFCGYGTTSLELLDALNEAYGETSHEERPKIILTDGCFIPNLNAKGFNLYLTFPHVGTPEKADKRDVEILKRISSKTQPISYEAFGYDAMLILGSAIKKCKAEGVVDRQSLLLQLNSVEVYTGTSGLYEFENGENRLAQYDIFHLTDKKEVGKVMFELDEVVTDRRLQEIRSQKR
jgi:branched-chain amino acid transport system substrate-binding protein